MVMMVDDRCFELDKDSDDFSRVLLLRTHAVETTPRELGEVRYPAAGGWTKYGTIRFSLCVAAVPSLTWLL
jgi:hypothetical protein